MSETLNAPQGLNTLLRLAREEAGVLRDDLADVAEARRAAEASLSALEGNGDLSERGRARRRAVCANLLTLCEAEEKARERFDAMQTEIDTLADLMRGSGAPDGAQGIVAFPAGAGRAVLKRA